MKDKLFDILCSYKCGLMILPLLILVLFLLQGDYLVGLIASTLVYIAQKNHYDSLKGDDLNE